MIDEVVSTELVLQRLRNRVIEYLSVVASAEEQREYQAAVPFVSVPNEMIEQWEDFMGEQGLAAAVPPLFTAEEAHALRKFHEHWNITADKLPYHEMNLEKLIAHPDWQHFISAAKDAYSVMMKRGTFPEDDLKRFTCPH